MLENTKLLRANQIDYTHDFHINKNPLLKLALPETAKKIKIKTPEKAH